MFRRVNPEEWIHLTSIVGFVLTFLVFLVAVIRAWRLRREKADHLARLPLESDDTASDPSPRHE
ncbi:MAG: CcoQ/FixQ family Cbb3-type cytochrome c oxidase assembly chaperone [Verrucomicrobiales bacterium]